MVCDPRARMCLAIGLVGVALSFGPALPGYEALYTVIPVLRAFARQLDSGISPHLRWRPSLGLAWRADVA